MRKRKLLVALAGLAVVMAAAVFVLWPRPDRMTRESFGRIRVGMNRAGVEDIVGPSGDFRTRPVQYSLGEAGSSWGEPTVSFDNNRTIAWMTNEGPGLVRLDPVGQVSKIHYTPARPYKQSAWDGLLWRAERQWHRWFP
jgi:hypothetical protein